jgi:hypothetical protein
VGSLTRYFLERATRPQTIGYALAGVTRPATGPTAAGLKTLAP